MQYLKKEVRSKILDAAISEFLEQGYSDASIRNIAQTAGISLGNIYRYFTNKEALYLAVVNPVLDVALKKINSLFGFNFENFEKLPAVVVEFMNEYRDRLSIVGKGGKEQYEAFINAIIAAVADNLRYCINERYPFLSDKIKNEGFYLSIASSFVHGLLVLIKEKTDDETKKENIKELLLFFFNKIDVRFK